MTVPPLETVPPAGARRVLVGGNFGHGNLGDEAMLTVMLAGLRGALPDVSVVVVSANPEATRRAHAVGAVHERDWPALIDAATASDLIVVGGGELLQDHFGVEGETFLTRAHRGLTYFAAFPALAALLGRPFMLYAIGVGPLSNAESERYVRLIVERADRVTLRDAESHRLIHSPGTDTRTIETTADPVYLTGVAPEEHVRALLDRVGVPPGRRPLVAVAIRHWEIGLGVAAGPPALASALDRLVAVHNATILFVPFHSGQEGALTDDRDAADRVLRAMQRRDAAFVADVPVDAEEARGLFAAADLVVAMHGHGAILAASAEIPVVALVFGPDGRRVMDQLGLSEHAVDLETATSDSLYELMMAALADGDRIRVRLQSVLPALRTAAARNTTVLVHLLTQPPAIMPLSPAWAAMLGDVVLPHTRRAAVHEAGVDFLHGQADAHARTITRLTERVQAQERLLEDRTTELSALGAELARLRTDLEWRPEHGYRRLRQAARKGVLIAWTGSVRVVSTAGRPVWWLSRTIYEALVPKTLRTALAAALSRRLMSWPAYAFDRYRQRRDAVYGSDLTGLHAPGQPELVSIVIPAYNGAAFIREAIDSVLAQTYRHLELIVVNDGSTDETPHIVDQYARVDPRVRVLHQSNLKLPRALSNGFHLAQGEFLTWTSCDNRLKPTFVERMVECLRRHPDWDMTYANLELIGEDGEPLRNTSVWDQCQDPPRSEHVRLPKATDQLNVVANNHIGAAFLYRSRVAHLVGDYSPFRFVMEDYDYWMRVNALMRLRHADFEEPGCDYRFHVESLTTRWQELEMRENRARLMVFEDFRRDFYLAPMIWVLDGDPGPAREELERRARHAGHAVYDGSYPLDALPGLGIPVVYAAFTAHPSGAAISRTDLPASALKVLIATSDLTPREVPEDWDLACVVGNRAPLPRLSGDYRGWLAAEDAGTLFHALDIRAKSAHLALIEAKIERPHEASLRASVIICTRALTDRVVHAIQSVAQQDFDPGGYELIVVSNSPSETTLRSAVEDLRATLFQHRPDRLRFVVCPVPGLSAARNAGLHEAQGEVVSFLDDDAVATTDWLTNICKAFAAHPSAGVIGGHISLKAPTPPPAALRPGWEKYWSQYLTEHDEYAEVADWQRFPWGASWSARRTALWQIGGFRIGYGRTGDNFWGGEELVAACLVQRLGYTIGVTPHALVVHDVAPARFTLAHVRRTIAAGHRVGHRARIDLYLPGAGPQRLPGLRALFTAHFDRTVASGRARWLDAMYRKLAQLRLAATDVGDLVRRARTPSVGGRS